MNDECYCLIELDTIYRIENRGIMPYKPSKAHHFSMYLDGEFYSLYLRKNNYEFKTSLEVLDAQLLYDTILKPILGIDDLRNNTRIDYLSGKKDIVNLKTIKQPFYQLLEQGAVIVQGLILLVLILPLYMAKLLFPQIGFQNAFIQKKSLI